MSGIVALRCAGGGDGQVGHLIDDVPGEPNLWGCDLCDRRFVEDEIAPSYTIPEHDVEVRPQPDAVA